MAPPSPTLPSCTPPDAASRTWRIFCRVIDNHGDLGVCWRLSCALADAGEAVTLQVDDASALAWMAPQGHPGVRVLPWDAPGGEDTEVVIEAFACEPPPAWSRARLARHPWPVWINLEYLSAEDWVERVHGLASPRWQPDGSRLDAWFLHPGFGPRTGGLILEPAVRAAMARDAVATQHAGPPGTVTVFCYEQPAFAAWMDAWRGAGARVRLTPGPATRQGRAWADSRGLVEDPAVEWLAPRPQIAFDALLRDTDLNIVRGEDSLVRALWARRPFVWHAYVQDDGAQHEKIDAFLARYLEGAPAPVSALVRAWHRAWNAQDPGRALPPPWPDAGAWQGWREWAAWRADDWAKTLPELTTTLRRFVSDRSSGHTG
jgi:uncharacterized repeat protein (TIGR03837 family)